ncbi:tRNA methyltransferase 10 homolog C-like [Antedon mediterranea]|uniref:tRNA methyltransferase 10 homolog C-like n=1 Tax=Antedon mediterranea TaxID=105859 RepID=UPI003AF556FF
MYHLLKLVRSLPSVCKNSVPVSVKNKTSTLWISVSQFKNKLIYQSRYYCSITNESSKETSYDRGLEEARELIEEMRLSGRQVPQQISDADLEHFASIKSKKQRKKFMTFMYRRECLRLKDKEKRLEKQEQRKIESEESKEYETLIENRLFLKMNPKRILESDNWKLSQGMKFGQNVVFDFCYDQYMQRRDAISLSMQISYVIHENKKAKESFHIHFVNHLEGSLSHKELVRTTTKDVYNKMMVTMNSQSLLETFPKEDIIYLSPDSPNIMRTFDDTKTYVIGALVDATQIQKGLTLGIAKRLNVSHVRLPIDYYLKWGSGGNKNLTLDQVIKILSAMKETNDWKEAMKHVPIRKHTGMKTCGQNQPTSSGQEPAAKDNFIFSRALRPKYK